MCGGEILQRKYFENLFIFEPHPTNNKCFKKLTTIFKVVLIRFISAICNKNNYSTKTATTKISNTSLTTTTTTTTTTTRTKTTSTKTTTITKIANSILLNHYNNEKTTTKSSSSSSTTTTTITK